PSWRQCRPMSLLVLFRTRLEWCNYTCGYCPWNATVRRVPTEEFVADEQRLNRIVTRVAELPRRVEFFITPKAEYLVLPYWRAAVARLCSLPQVERVTVQTNLSFDVGAFLDVLAPSHPPRPPFPPKGGGGGGGGETRPLAR